ncbi:uncharacterized protein [Fopius arisanus]|uniref:Kinetochore protein Spc24 n=1 Tax=Fopius arisanus TaxID=64838 RepID=A0A9R1T8I6_9HYME|nr:PREDICTED: uncharacterized protein LOC105267487 [Fopius arisanus]
MDKILALQDKFEAPSVEILEEALKQHLIALKRRDNEQDHLLTENAAKIAELEGKKLELEKRITQEQSKHIACLDELERRNKILKEREHEKTRLITENRHKEAEKNKIMSKCKMPSVTDENTLENGRKKFEYYKNLTGIRWDYPMLKNGIKGYVTNKQDYIHPFFFELDQADLTANLWEEIAKSTTLKGSE